MNFLKSYFLFSETAVAAGMKPKVLRNWLVRNEPKLLADYSGTSWTHFAVADVFVLGLMRELVNWGVSVDDANELAFKVVVQRAGSLWGRQNDRERVLSHFAETDLVVIRKGEGVEGMFLFSGASVADLPPHDSAVVVHLERIFGKIMDRLQGEVEAARARGEARQALA